MNKSAFQPHEEKFLKSLMLVGGGGGVAAGLAVSYANYLKRLHEESARANARGLRVVVPTDEEEEEGYKQASAGDPAKPEGKFGGMTLALAPTALALPAILGYTLSRKAYQKLKAAELQRQLQDSEEAYVTALQAEADQLKQASDPPAPSGGQLSTGEWVKMLLLGGLPVSMLASAYLTNKVLDRRFPALESPNREAPTPLQIAYSPPRKRPKPQPLAPEEEESEVDQWSEAEKQAAVVESLCRVAIGLGHPDSQLPDLLVKAGRDTRACEEVLARGGVDALVAFSRGAASREAWQDPIERTLGYRAACKSAAAPVLELLAAAEIDDHCPGLVHACRHVEPEVGEMLAKEACLRVRLSAAHECLASEPTMTFLKAAGLLPEQAMSDVNQNLQPGIDQVEVPDMAETDLVGSVSAEDITGEASDRPAISGTQRGPKDMVDITMGQLTGNG